MIGAMFEGIKGRVSGRQLLALLLLAALLARVAGARWGLPLLLHPDENKLIDPALRMLDSGSAHPGGFLYPSFYIYAQAAVAGLLRGLSALGGRAAPEMADYYWWGRALTAALGTATLALAWACARAAGARAWSLLAAALVAVSVLHLGQSMLITTDIPATLWVSACLLACLRVARGHDAVRDYLLAGAMAGLAAGSKYNGGLVALALVAVHLSRGFSLTALFDRRLLAGGAAAMAAFLVSTPYALVEPGELGRFLVLQSDAYAQHPGAGTGAATSYAAYWATLLRKFGGPQLLLAGIGAAALCTRARSTAAVLGGFPLLYFAFMGAYPVHFERNAVVLLPALGALAAVGAATAWQASAKPGGARGAMLLRALLLLVLVAGAWQQASRSAAHLRLARLPDTRLLAMNWMQQNLPRRSTVALEHYTPPLAAGRLWPTRLGYGGLVRSGGLAGFDYLVASSGDYGRFVNHPERYPEQAAAYQRVFASNELVKVFRPDWQSSSGPEIRVYLTPGGSRRVERRLRRRSAPPSAP